MARHQSSIDFIARKHEQMASIQAEFGVVPPPFR